MSRRQDRHEQWAVFWCSLLGLRRPEFFVRDFLKVNDRQLGESW